MFTPPSEVFCHLFTVSMTIAADTVGLWWVLHVLLRIHFSAATLEKPTSENLFPGSHQAMFQI